MAEPDEEICVFHYPFYWEEFAHKMFPVLLTEPDGLEADRIATALAALKARDIDLERHLEIRPCGSGGSAAVYCSIDDVTVDTTGGGGFDDSGSGITFTLTETSTFCLNQSFTALNSVPDVWTGGFELDGISPTTPYFVMGETGASAHLCGSLTTAMTRTAGTYTIKPFIQTSTTGSFYNWRFMQTIIVGSDTSDDCVIFGA